jgi:predicted SnoaL-like aldol condensation-catalyzing enzyme
MVNEIRIAEEYFYSLFSGKFEKVRELSSLDLIFEDPTTPVGVFADKIVGLDAFVDYFSDLNKNSDSNVKIVKSYASNNKVVLYTKSTVTADAKTFNLEGGKISFEIVGTTILELRESLVIKHSDYYDYEGAFASITSIE